MLGLIDIINSLNFFDLAFPLCANSKMKRDYYLVVSNYTCDHLRQGDLQPPKSYENIVEERRGEICIANKMRNTFF